MKRQPSQPIPACEPLIPLSVLSLDAGATVSELAARLADVMLVDDLHRPCVDRPTAAQVIREYQDAQAAEATRQCEADRRWREELNARPHPADRVAAIAAAQERLRADGVDPAQTLELIGCDRDQQGRQLDRRTAVLDDLLHGRSTGARFTVQHSDQ